MTEPTTDEGCVKWTLSSGDVVVEITATLDDSGNVVFNYELVSGVADLNGFYIDLGNDGGTIRKLEGGNNMNGSDSDGDKLDGFDFAEVIGTVGGNDADTTSGTVTYSLAEMGITSLADLADAEIGIRATSVGEDREGSLKLAGTGTFCPPEPEDLCDRPLDGVNVDGYVAMSQDQIVSLTLSFYDGLNPTPGDTTKDARYSVQINVPAEMAEDPDAYLDELVALLVAEDGYVQELGPEYFLKSVTVTDCHGEQSYYKVFGNDNGEATDTVHWGQFGTQNGTTEVQDVDVAAHTDAIYDLSIVGDAFVFA